MPRRACVPPMQARSALVLLLVAAAAFAGCAQHPAVPTTTDGAPARLLPSGVQVYRNGTAADLAALLSPSAFGTAVWHAVNHTGAEPNIGITSDGSIFVSSFSAVLRSMDNGTTWTKVQEHQLLNSDPMLWVDDETDRVYNAPMFPTLACATIYWSDDAGATWDQADSAACGAGPFDHQKLVTGKPGPDANPAAGVLWPTVTYLCYNSVATTDCAASYDGGRTWPVDKGVEVNLLPHQGPESQVPTTGCGSGQNGHPTAAPDGTVVFARTGPACPIPFLTESRDSGLTWTLVDGPHSDNPTSLDPEVAFSLNGTLYLLFQDAQFHEVLARSKDMGHSWQGVWDVMPPGVTSSSFSALAAGSEGRVAMGFLGTTQAKGSPTEAPDNATWALYIVTSDDANGASPTFTSYKVTGDDPVQRGPIWQGGGGDPSRNLLDFIDGAVAPDGTFHVVYADGCVSTKCLSADGKPDDSRDAVTSVGHLTGWSLFAPGEHRPGKHA